MWSKAHDPRSRFLFDPCFVLSGQVAIECEEGRDFVYSGCACDDGDGFKSLVVMLSWCWGRKYPVTQCQDVISRDLQRCLNSATGGVGEALGNLGGTCPQDVPVSKTLLDEELGIEMESEGVWRLGWNLGG